MDDVLANTDALVDDINRPTITPERLKDFIRYIVQNIVTDADQVDVAIMEDVPGSYTVHIKVAQEDKGRVIGKKGNTINALRALVRVFGRIIILLQD
jgi:uncharacterized protein